jgi:hypothetical protein
MHATRNFVALLLVIMVASVATRSFAQTAPPNSDLLREFSTDHNASAASPDVPILPGFPPILTIKIPEVIPEATP